MEIARGAAARMFDVNAAGAEWDTRPWLVSFLDGRRRRLGFQTRDLIYEWFLKEWFLKWPWDAWLGRRNVTRA